METRRRGPSRLYACLAAKSQYPASLKQDRFRDWRIDEEHLAGEVVGAKTADRATRTAASVRNPGSRGIRAIDRVRARWEAGGSDFSIAAGGGVWGWHAIPA